MYNILSYSDCRHLILDMTEDEDKSPVLLTAEGASPCLDTAYLLSTIRLLEV